MDCGVLVRSKLLTHSLTRTFLQPCQIFFHQREYNPRQPYAQFEPKVCVAVSKVHGLGVFTTRRIRKGEVVCVYTGECVSCVDGNFSAYVLSCKWVNRDKVVEEWNIDATDVNNAAGRLINDACDTYTDGPGKDLKTEYCTNVKYGEYCSNEVHPDIGKYYVEVFALCDIEKDAELFVSYGTKYWKAYQRYKKFEDPRILVGARYDERMAEVCGNASTD